MYLTIMATDQLCAFVSCSATINNPGKVAHMPIKCIETYKLKITPQHAQAIFGLEVITPFSPESSLLRFIV